MLQEMVINMHILFYKNQIKMLSFILFLTLPRSSSAIELRRANNYTLAENQLTKKELVRKRGKNKIKQV